MAAGENSDSTCSSSHEGGWVRVLFTDVRFSLSSQYGAYPGGPEVMNVRRYCDKKQEGRTILHLWLKKSFHFISFEDKLI